MFEKKFRPQDFDRLLESPKLKSRLFVLNIITIALFAAPIVYAVIIASGVITGEGSLDLGFQIWWILAAISIMHIPALFMIGFLMMSQAESAASFSEAFQKAQAALIVILALGESVCVFGLIASILGAPEMVAYGFLAFGVILMSFSLIVFRPKAIGIVAKKLVEEERGTG